VSPAERLTASQERDLVVATEAGDPEACRRLVEASLPEIAALTHLFRVGRGVGRAELIQEGVAGLLFAARRYDQSLDAPFWAYASFWVRKVRPRRARVSLVRTRPGTVTGTSSANPADGVT
jgi:RNA polymerase primary sigma factor